MLEPEKAPEPAAMRRLEGERRIATIILADVSGSTDLLERVGTERWVLLMNEMFQLLEAEIYRFGGQVDQFRGDGLVAFFGAKVAHEDDPERAVRAALAMQHAMGQHTSQLKEREGITLSLRVGVNTGEVIVANVGDRAWYTEDTAMGEAIAIAARMEQTAEPGTVLVTAATYALVAPIFEWKALGEVLVKGISTPITVYCPLRSLEKRDVSPDSLVYGLDTRLVGRDAEFETLVDAVESLEKGRGGIILLDGERGMGKSFLLATVRKHVQRRAVLLARAGQDQNAAQPRSLLWLRGRGRSYDQSTPFALWLDLLRDWLNLDPDVSPEVGRALLWTEAQVLWGASAAEHFAVLAIALSLSTASEAEAQVRALDAERLRQRVSQTLISWVQALTRQASVVISFSNVHWADTSSIELLKEALPLCDTASVLWVVARRPERTSHVWDFQHHVETEYPHRLVSLTLRPLDDEQSSALLTSLLGPDVLLPQIRNLLLRKAEGNPYYLRELVLSLITNGVLAQDTETGRWRTTRAIDSLDLPDSLQSVLRARIDSLDPETRRILQVAAAIGSTFWHNVLATLVDSPDGSVLQRHLTALLRAQLVYERERVPVLGMAYAFKSTLVCDVVYESLLSAQRTSYHQRIARYFEDKLAKEGALGLQYYGLLAYHYCQAGDHAQELRTTIQAATQAQRVFANVEALDHYAHALGVLDELEAQTTDGAQKYELRRQRVEVMLGRAALLRLHGDFATWRQEAPVLLALARTLERDPHLVVDALLEQVGVAYWSTLDEVRNARDLAQEALARARSLGDRRREMLCLGSCAAQLYTLGEPEWLQEGEQSLVLARELGDRRHELLLLTGVGSAFAMSDPQRSVEYLELALPVAETLDDPDAELQLVSLLGVQMEDTIDYLRRIRDCHERALRLARSTGNRIAEAQTLMFLGQIRALYLGDYEAGLLQLEEALGIMGDSAMALYPLLRVAQIRIEQGRLVDAEVALTQAHAIIDQGRIEAGQTTAAHQATLREIAQIGLAGLDLVTIMLYNTYGDETRLAEALRIAESLKDVLSENPQSSRHYSMTLACKLSETHIKLAQGAITEVQRADHRRQALALSEQALDLYNAIGFVRPVELTSQEIMFTHSQVLRLAGREQEADGYVQRAYDEMMQKVALMPENSAYRHTFLTAIPLHRQISAAYALRQARQPLDGVAGQLALNGSAPPSSTA